MEEITKKQDFLEFKYYAEKEKDVLEKTTN